MENISGFSLSDDCAELPSAENMSCLSGSDSYTGWAPVENMSGFSGSDDYMGWPPAEIMSAFSGFDNHMEWPPVENMSGFSGSDNWTEWSPVANMSGFSGFCGRATGEVDLYGEKETYVSNGHAEHGTLVNSINIDGIEKRSVSRSTIKPPIPRWQPHKGKKANKHVGGVSQEDEEHPQEDMHTADLQDQRPDLDLENVMASSSMGTQGITTQDNNRLWVKVEYNNDIVKFVLCLATMDGLKREILKRYKLEADTLKFRYKDEDGELITIVCDEDLHCCLEYFKSSGRAPVRLSLLTESIGSFAHA